MADRGVARQLQREIDSAERARVRALADDTDAALAALSGTITEARPDTGLERNMLRLRLVLEAQRAGASWQVIGQALGGISGKAAKRQMKHLAAKTQRQLLAAKHAQPRPKVRRQREAPERRTLTVLTDEELGASARQCRGRECDC